MTACPHALQAGIGEDGKLFKLQWPKFQAFIKCAPIKVMPHLRAAGTYLKGILPRKTFAGGISDTPASAQLGGSGILIL